MPDEATTTNYQGPTKNNDRSSNAEQVEEHRRKGKEIEKRVMVKRDQWMVWKDVQ
ncbi:hypothetical protein PPACK8108_LOCUS14862 [Phakopsora pachyrhizi]|uniref:Uncharacterized protein n=1 Tax=Phakopsora pachyrhizi TaxID=170000 RepID=A0AAV0B7V7_PHAPC|nr:hypothetical protein PPACK8108_LOCUS14862 [Phakopsora pachyrhizi]